MSAGNLQENQKESSKLGLIKPILVSVAGNVVLRSGDVLCCGDNSYVIN